MDSPTPTQDSSIGYTKHDTQYQFYQSLGDQNKWEDKFCEGSEHTPSLTRKFQGCKGKRPDETDRLCPDVEQEHETFGPS